MVVAVQRCTVTITTANISFNRVTRVVLIGQILVSLVQIYLQLMLKRYQSVVWGPTVPWGFPISRTFNPSDNFVFITEATFLNLFLSCWDSQIPE